jgi:hypothetical protein
LCEFKDYRGYTIVFSGNRSLHFHFVFSIEHLKNCPLNVPLAERVEGEHLYQAATLGRAHDTYWDSAKSIVCETLGGSLKPDTKLRSIVQWRRLPWGIRELEKDSEILDLPAGTIIPQLVLLEDVRTRASTSASNYCVPESFSTAHPIPRKKQSSGAQYSVSSGMLAALRDVCEGEWGDYPYPTSIEQQQGQWLFKFKNHANDQNPSSLVFGDYRQLQINGKNNFEREHFFLPHEMSAQEWGDYLARYCGVQSKREHEKPAPPVPELTRFEQLRAQRGVTYPELFRRQLERNFREPISEFNPELKRFYSNKLGGALLHARTICAGMPMLVKSVEGIGKTSALRWILADEALDRAMMLAYAKARKTSELRSILANEALDPAEMLVDAEAQSSQQSFTAFAFRSVEQAEKKAAEFRDRGFPTVVVNTFWRHPEAACEATGVKPLGRDDFDSRSPSELLSEIRDQSEDLFKTLERRRKQLWQTNGAFDCGTTILLMTHALASHWHYSTLNRAWHHPKFHPDCDSETEKRLSHRFGIREVVFDDPEVDLLLHHWSALKYDFISKQQDAFPDWKDQRRAERVEVYCSLNSADFPEAISFEEFNELMHVDLEKLHALDVDYARFPFGKENSDQALYKGQHGKQYYIGRKDWLRDMTAYPTFLTTEEIVSKVIKTIYENEPSKYFHWFDLDEIAGVFPIKIPLRTDRRARKDSEDKAGVSQLAEEIISDDPNALVIADGVDAGISQVLTFQRMKGLNELEDKNIYVILRYLAPEKYAELNILGQWLQSETTIQDFYQDQINQAVGRNRGFREHDTPTKTVAVSISAFWMTYLSKMPKSRILLYPDGKLKTVGAS